MMILIRRVFRRWIEAEAIRLANERRADFYQKFAERERARYTYLEQHPEHSPSRIWAEMGHGMGDGLAKGR